MARDEELVINWSVCAGRHPFPECVTGSVYGDTIPDKYVTRPDILRHIASIKIWEEVSKHYDHIMGVGWDEEGEEVYCADNVHLNLYVTGLTVATVAIITACHDLNIFLTLWHYDRNTGKYYKQEVLI